MFGKIQDHHVITNKNNRRKQTRSFIVEIILIKSNEIMFCHCYVLSLEKIEKVIF